MTLENKIALVTGASRGLGAAIAAQLKAQGATVIITDYNAEAGQATAARLGERCHFIEQDVTDWDRWGDVMAQMDARFGRLDVLVNNAAITVYGSIADLSPEDFRRCYTFDVDSIFMGCKAAIPLIARSGGGSIVNFSSAAGVKANADLAAYNSAKAAVPMLTKSIALYCARERNRVRVNCVQPGPIKTGMTAAIPEEAQTRFARRRVPLRRYGEPEEVAQMTLSLCLPAMSYLTGANVPVDGGLLIQNT